MAGMARPGFAGTKVTSLWTARSAATATIDSRAPPPCSASTWRCGQEILPLATSRAAALSASMSAGYGVRAAVPCASNVFTGIALLLTQDHPAFFGGVALAGGALGSSQRDDD